MVSYCLMNPLLCHNSFAHPTTGLVSKSNGDCQVPATLQLEPAPHTALKLAMGLSAPGLFA
jgi:hypothetical protein